MRFQRLIFDVANFRHVLHSLKSERIIKPLTMATLHLWCCHQCFSKLVEKNRPFRTATLTHQQPTQLLRRGRELAEASVHHSIRQRQIQIAESPFHPRMIYPELMSQGKRVEPDGR